MLNRPLRVVVAGHSNLTFSESGPDATAIALLRSNLQSALPDREVQVKAVVTPILGRIAPKVMEVVEAVRPDVAVVTLLGTSFAVDFVTNRIRRKWRRAYYASLKFSEMLKALAANATDDGPPRRHVYRIPEALAFALIGGEPFTTVERAAQQAIDVVEALAAREEVETLVRLPGITAGLSGAAYRAGAARIESFDAIVSAYCDKRRLRVFRIDEALREFGGLPHYAADGVHLDLETRKLEALVTARWVLAALGVEATR